MMKQSDYTAVIAMATMATGVTSQPTGGIYHPRRYPSEKEQQRRQREAEVRREHRRQKRLKQKRGTFHDS